MGVTEAGEVLECVIPVLPPSMNAIYGVRLINGRVSFFLKSEGKRFKENAKMFMPRFKVEDGVVFDLYMEVHTSWLCKNGSVKKVDIMNLDKLICDAIAEKYMRGADERVWVRTIKKVESKSREIHIRMRQFRGGSG